VHSQYIHPKHPPDKEYRDDGSRDVNDPVARDYGTRVLTNTGNLAAVMKTMGHRDVRAAMQYQHPDLEIVRFTLNRTNRPCLQKAASEIP
jgi:hypothetical protein